MLCCVPFGGWKVGQEGSWHRKLESQQPRPMPQHVTTSADTDRQQSLISRYVYCYSGHLLRLISEKEAAGSPNANLVFRCTLSLSTYIMPTYTTISTFSNAFPKGHVPFARCKARCSRCGNLAMKHYSPELRKFYSHGGQSIITPT